MSSLLPFLLELERPRRLPDQHFALALTPQDILTFVNPQPQANKDYYRPWHQLNHHLRDSGSTIQADKSRFQINLDVQHFAPEDINVRTVDGFVVIEGRHEEKQDQHGWVSRQFTRRYALPEGCNPESVQSRLSSDGVLTVVAPLLRQECANERSVPIVRTGPVRTQGGTSNILEGGDIQTEKPAENGE